MSGTPSAPSGHARTWVLVSFALIYTVWGSTYLAMRVAVETLPPFLLAGARFFVSGLALLAWLRLRGVALPNEVEWRHAAIAGTLMLAGGNGVVVWAEQSVPSNLAALIIALSPMWFALLEWLRPGGIRPSLQTLIGIVVGFAGVVLLISGQTDGHAASVPGKPAEYLGLGALVLSGISWSAGSLWSRYHPHAPSPWMTGAAQMICGGAAQIILALALGEMGDFHAQQVSGRSWLALSYLVVFGSWIAYSAYIYLLKASTPSRIATYAYVNPVIAMLLGWLILGEKLGAQSLWSAAVILIGVVITTLPKRA